MANQTFTNDGAVALVIGDTTIAAGGTDTITAEEADALAVWYPTASFTPTLDPATDHFDSLSYGAHVTSEA